MAQVLQFLVQYSNLQKDNRVIQNVYKVKLYNVHELIMVISSVNIP